MTRDELETLFAETLRSERPTAEQFAGVADAVLALVRSGEPRFLDHVRNRLRKLAESGGEQLDIGSFDIGTARRLVADEIGFASWDGLIEHIETRAAGDRPILFKYAVAAMVRGDFTALESMIGGEHFDETIIDWYEKGLFRDEPKTLAEIFSAACMLGYVRTAEYLLDHGVDPLAGQSTGLNGFHYAASSGRLDVIKLLIERKVPMEVKNMYGGTVFGQAIWSAVNEWTPRHAEIVGELVKAGAIVDEGYRMWWDEQNVPDAGTKRRIAEVLRQHEEFQKRLDSAKQKVQAAESEGNSRILAESLKSLGNILRRPPFLRNAANEVYERAANMYRELGEPLEEAWVKRHIGINHEYAGRLADAERYYDEALALYRKHSTENDLDYANAVRYPAVIKERLGKKDEAALLWAEAYDRYVQVRPDELGEGVAEAAAWLTILAIERGDLENASIWFARASEASSRSADPGTHKFIGEVRERLEKAGIS